MYVCSMSSASEVLLRNGSEGEVWWEGSIRLHNTLNILSFCACCLLLESSVHAHRWSLVNVHFKQKKPGHFLPSPVTAADFIVTWRVIGLFCLMGSQALDHNWIYTVDLLYVCSHLTGNLSTALCIALAGAVSDIFQIYGRIILAFKS
jgi:hypothetical protein